MTTTGVDISSYYYGGAVRTGSVMDGIQIDYEYSKKDNVIAYTDISYATIKDTSDDFLDPIYGNITTEPQRIANSLPHWMEWRQDPSSVGQTITHAWAQNLDHVKKIFTKKRKDHFLATADTMDDFHYGSIDMGSFTAGSYIPEFKNFLYNSSFSILSPSRYNKPMGWDVKETFNPSTTDLSVDKNVATPLSIYKGDSIFGQNSILLHGEVGACQISQRRNVRGISNGSLTFSIFFKEDTTRITAAQESDQGNLNDASEAGIILQLEYIDSTVKSFGAGFKTRTGRNWYRLACTATITKELASVAVIILNNTSEKYIIDLPQLERGKISTPWTSSLFDVHPTQDGRARNVSGMQVLSSDTSNYDNQKIEVLPTFSSEEFQSIKIPTRVAPVFTKEDSRPIVTTQYSSRINYHGEEQVLLWPAENGNIIEKSLTTPDAFGQYLPAEYVYDDKGSVKIDKSLINATGISIKATTILDDILYCVAQESYNGFSKYSLKVVVPHRVSETGDYLQCLSDINLPVTLGKSFGLNAKSENITRMGFSKSIVNTIYLDTDLDRRFYFRLFYDYYYADLGARKIYCREKYWPDYGQLQVV